MAHDVNANCAERFAELASSRDQMKEEVAAIKSELHALAGNGNRGKIDKLSDNINDYALNTNSRLSVVETQVSGIITRMDSIESKFWAFALKMGGVVGGVVAAVDWLSKK